MNVTLDQTMINLLGDAGGYSPEERANMENALMQALGGAPRGIGFPGILQEPSAEVATVFDKTIAFAGKVKTGYARGA